MAALKPMQHCLDGGSPKPGQLKLQSAKHLADADKRMSARSLMRRVRRCLTWSYQYDKLDLWFRTTQNVRGPSSRAA